MTGTEEVPAGVLAKLQVQAERETWSMLERWVREERHCQGGKRSAEEEAMRNMNKDQLVQRRLGELQQEWLAGVAALALV